MPLASLAVLAGAAQATWSVVCVDTKTGEVCVASATCLSNFDLRKWLPVLRIGEGAAAAQSAIDSGGRNRTRMWRRIQDGFAPRMILEELAAHDNLFQSRQIGIVTMTATPATFTGTNAGFARFGVTGQIDTIKYSIQGNVLTGNDVIKTAETLFRRPGGDLGQRVMRAMMMARAMGGDGRCSCSPGNPTGCGTPPPSFDQSARVAFIVLGRIGDPRGECNVTNGCANGDYYLSLQFFTGPSGPDPVFELRDMYADWRGELVGRPDQLLSAVESAADSLVADGISETIVNVTLADVEGNPLMNGGANLSVEWSGEGEAVATAGPVTDHGDGSYSFSLQAGTTAGEGSWSLTVDDGIGDVRLYPDLGVRVDPLAQLHAGSDTVSLTEGANVAFTINLGAAEAGRAYILLGSNTGTTPGQMFRGIHLALNPGAFFELTLTQPGPPNFPGSEGVLDGQGRATAGFVASPAELLAFGGTRFDWVTVIGTGTNIEATNGVGFDVVP